MKCLHPRILNPRFDKHGDTIPQMLVPCGKCIYCRLARSFEWTVRAEFESRYVDQFCFLTLTLSDENLTYTKLGQPTVVKRDLQLFLKRLRKKFDIRSFFACGEYGSRRGRPHYHMLIFGWQPPDIEFLKNSYSGYPLYKSDIVSSLWNKGLVFVGVSCDGGCAGYVARYSLKKQWRLNADDKYMISRNLKPCQPFFLSSRRIPFQYLGHEYFGAIGCQFVVDNIDTLLRGYLNDSNDPRFKKSVPRYFLKVLEKIGVDLTFLKSKRLEVAEENLRKVKETRFTRELEDNRMLAQRYINKAFERFKRNLD